MNRKIYWGIQSVIRYQFQAGTSVREIDAQTEIDNVQPRVTMMVAGGCVGIGDIRNHYFSRAGALPGNGNFHQNTIIITFFTLIITITI